MYLIRFALVSLAKAHLANLHAKQPPSSPPSLRPPCIWFGIFSVFFFFLFHSLLFSITTVVASTVASLRRHRRRAHTHSSLSPMPPPLPSSSLSSSVTTTKFLCSISHDTLSYTAYTYYMLLHDVFVHNSLRASLVHTMCLHKVSRRGANAVAWRVQLCLLNRSSVSLPSLHLFVILFFLFLFLHTRASRSPFISAKSHHQQAFTARPWRCLFFTINSLLWFFRRHD